MPLPMPLLSVESLSKRFRTPHGAATVVDGVSFHLDAGETLALVGESGCGKTTLGRLILRLIEPDGGRVLLDGQDLTALGGADLRRARASFQMIFQDPYASLDPRRTVGGIVEDPLRIHGRGDRAERRHTVERLLERVGLAAGSADRHPHEFSGGQRQRISIARALTLKPRLIVCDEPVSALDLSIRAQIINLLVDLQAEFGLAYLFISHDLSMVRHIADRVAVMEAGRIVEIGPTGRIWTSPAHARTRSLLAAAPVPDPGLARAWLDGDAGIVPQA